MLIVNANPFCEVAGILHIGSDCMLHVFHSVRRIAFKPVLFAAADGGFNA